MRLLFLAAFGACAWLMDTGSAWACGTCATGSPAMTVAGQGQATAGRLRWTLEARMRREVLRDETGRLVHRLDEGVLTAGVAYAPNDRSWLLAEVPVVLRHARWETHQTATTLGVSDIRLRGRTLLFRNEGWAPEHLFGLTAGLSLPTLQRHDSDFQESRQGTERRLPALVQSGSGAFGVSGGVFYWAFADPFALFAEASFTGVPWTRWDNHPGHALEAEVAGQVRLADAWSLRLGVLTRGNLGVDRNEGRSRSHDALAVVVSPAVLFSPTSNILLLLGSQISAMEASPEDRTVSPSLHLSVTVDG